MSFERTNDVLKSNLHRVVQPPVDRECGDGTEMTKERYSVAFFIQGDRPSVVQCAKNLEGTGAKYPPISVRDYIGMRTSANFKQGQQQYY